MYSCIYISVVTVCTIVQVYHGMLLVQWCPTNRTLSVSPSVERLRLSQYQ